MLDQGFVESSQWLWTDPPPKSDQYTHTYTYMCQICWESSQKTETEKGQLVDLVYILLFAESLTYLVLWKKKKNCRMVQF